MAADDNCREQTNRANINKPVSELRCPNPDCRAKEARRDRELSDHPGVFECARCGEVFFA